MAFPELFVLNFAHVKAGPKSKTLVLLCLFGKGCRPAERFVHNFRHHHWYGRRLQGAHRLASSVL